MSRDFWPIPNPNKTFHLIGDIQTPTAARMSIVTEDMQSGLVPDVPYRITVGDFINSGASGFPDSAYIPMIEFIESLGTGEWWSCVGNHDAHDRTPAQAAALMGMPDVNFVVDLGFMVFVFIWARCVVAGQQPGQSYPTDVAWLEAQLANYPDRKVAVVAHPPLYDPRPINSISTENDEILAVLDANPCVKMWLCGHTHVDIEHEGIANSINTGTRNIAQLNGSALVYTTPLPVRWDDRLCSLFVTVNDDHIEVRARDHGARQWVGLGPAQTKVWTHPI